MRRAVQNSDIDDVNRSVPHPEQTIVLQLGHHWICHLSE
jgi:hypothetical protein